MTVLSVGELPSWIEQGILGAVLLAVVLWLRSIANRAIDLGVDHVKTLGKTNEIHAQSSRELAVGVKRLGDIADATTAKLDSIHSDVRAIQPREP